MFTNFVDHHEATFYCNERKAIISDLNGIVLFEPHYYRLFCRFANNYTLIDSYKARAKNEMFIVSI